MKQSVHRHKFEVHLTTDRGFPDGSAVKNLPAMREIWVRSLDWQDPLEEKMATHSSILAWKKNPTDRGARQATCVSKELDMTEQLGTHTKKISGQRNGNT